MMFKTILLYCCAVAVLSLVGCKGVEPRPETETNSPPTASQTVEVPSVHPIQSPTPIPPVASTAKDSKPIAKLKPLPSAPPVQAITKPKKSPPPPDHTWRLRKGRLEGPDSTIAAKTISTFTDPKNGSITIDKCWNYGEFAVVESKTKGEIGAGEINIRHKGSGNICAAEYAGKTDSLKIGEGYFAGAAGDYVLVDGADASEGLLDFQLFSVETGKLVYKGQHHPSEDFIIARKNAKTSLEFFAKMIVKCELALEEQSCWKKILADNNVKRSIQMPDCTAAFKKSKASSFDSALVTARARVENISAPTLKFTGPTATCQAAP